MTRPTGEASFALEHAEHGLPLLLTFTTTRDWLEPDPEFADPGGWEVTAKLREARCAGTLLDLAALEAAMGTGWRKATEADECARMLADLAPDEGARQRADDAHKEAA